MHMGSQHAASAVDDEAKERPDGFNHGKDLREV
jgi:hypothetical protein